MMVIRNDESDSEGVRSKGCGASEVKKMKKRKREETEKGARNEQ